MRLCAPFFLFSVAILFAPASHAIFADEAYQTDSHLSLLGFPQAQNTFFHRPSAASKASLLYTLSEKLVVGAINPKDGAVIWRQWLQTQTENQTAPWLLKATEGGNTLVSAVNGEAKVWDATDGRLVWEWKGDGKIKGLETFTAAGGEKDVLVLSEKEGSNAVVRRLAGEAGGVTWDFVDGRYAGNRTKSIFGMCLR